ncbi:MAG TPA: prolipoprotein diacylglyceryl transferase family protein [Terriglobales bacterium]|nr:prolipoprotein diacylglyceryl transferase family protein [Terriglobales bacterium]
MIPYIHLGPVTIGSFGLLMLLAFIAAYLILRADIRRRGSRVDAQNVITICALLGIAGAKLYHVFETPSDLIADPIGQIFSRSGFAWFGGLLGVLLALWLLARHYKISYLAILDLCAPAAALGYAVGRIGCLTSGDGDYGTPTSLPWGMSFPNGLVKTTQHVHPTPIYEAIAATLIFWYLWRQGGKSIFRPRPVGEVAALYLIWMGVERFFVEFIRINPRSFFGMSNAQGASLVSIAAGLIILVTVKKKFRSQKGEHRILRHFEERGDVLQPEYHRPTPECPHPERWSMYDSMTAEVEVLEFLRCLVRTVKPQTVVETGTFMGVSTLWIAEGLKANGFGKIVTCEYDPVVFGKAKKRIAESGLGGWIDPRNESSLEIKIPGTIDLLFSDSDPPLREQEVRRFLPQMNPNGLILMHDASSHLKTVREAALKMEQEGLISVVLMPTPRGLVVAQKREGRK